MATPKPKATTKATVKIRSPKPMSAQPGRSPKVNASTGFVTGTVKATSTKSNPVTTKRAAPAPGKDPWSTGKIGEFINSAVGQMTGKIPSPISGAMKNKTPVLPYTQKNIKAIKKARGK